MSRYFFLALVTLAFPSTAFAQDSAEDVSTPASTKKDKPNELAFVVSIEPRFDRNNIAERGQRLQDAVATSKAGFEYTINSSRNVSVTLQAGASWTIDFGDQSDLTDEDDESGSGLYAGAEFAWERGCRRLRPIGSLEYEHNRRDFFGDRDGNSLTAALGADVVFFDRDLCASPALEKRKLRLSSFTLQLTPKLERVESSEKSDERWAPRFELSASKNIVSGIKAIGSFDYQYRIFDIPDPEAGFDKVHYFTGSTGIDFAGLLGDDAIVDELSLGLSWEVVDQEGTDRFQDDSALSFTPKIGFRIPLGG